MVSAKLQWVSLTKDLGYDPQTLQLSYISPWLVLFQLNSLLADKTMIVDMVKPTPWLMAIGNWHQYQDWIFYASFENNCDAFNSKQFRQRTRPLFELAIIKVPLDLETFLNFYFVFHYIKIRPVFLEITL